MSIVACDLAFTLSLKIQHNAQKKKKGIQMPQNLQEQNIQNAQNPQNASAPKNANHSQDSGHTHTH